METQDLLVALRDQPFEAGARQTLNFLWEVPEGWETEVLAVPPGTVVPLEVTITTVDDGVYVEVQGEAPLVGQCIRCMKDITIPMSFNIGDVYGYEDRPRKRRRAEALDTGKRGAHIEVTGDDLDAALLIDRDTIDLEPLLRDALFADAPFQPLCDEDCLGICEHCGVLLADAEPGHAHEFLDPRFQALAGFFDDQVSNEEKGGQSSDGSKA